MAYFNSKKLGKGKRNKTMKIGMLGRGYSKARASKRSKYHKGKAY
jgi:hypothetical protein